MVAWHMILLRPILLPLLVTLMFMFNAFTAEPALRLYTIFNF